MKWNNRDNETLICADGLSIAYGRKHVLDHADFNVPIGVTGLIGANGSGKSSLMQVLATIRRHQSGSVFINGADISNSQGRMQARASLGYLPQVFDVMRGATVVDNVAYAAWAHGIPDTAIVSLTQRILRDVDLIDLSNVKARKLSGGQRQRLGFACAVVHKPKVILLDEPTIALDESQRKRMHRLIVELGRGSAVLMSSHLLEEMKSFVGGVITLSNGCLYSDGNSATDGVIKT
ncbi:ATP-binding cassette domain-containing protein [Bifidobacterium callimiconis]|uniref:ABC transporter ATP-binding protein n=1 Tax=Bifidobacterium callimiconis TaxID=2306973 RepID=UPI001BDCFDB8|nr:ATP-binding cassette domain-containing protein [Bifidobacterium callimiconis]MBT1178039.1 ATP-binding cassette domain-containing protein [Bifidobacterium callimiconis]